MNDNAVIDRLRSAAERIDVQPDLDRVTSPNGTLRSTPRHSGRPASRLVMIAACVVLVAAGGVGLALRDRDNTGTSPAAEQWLPPTPVPSAAPAPGTLAPHVVTKPQWLDDVGPGVRDSGVRRGRWVSTAIARAEGDAYVDPIVVSVFDGEYSTMQDARVEDISGRQLRSVGIGSWHALATDSTPTMLVEGTADTSVLANVLDSSRITENGSEFSIVVDALPDGYEVIVAPQVLGDDTAPRRTLASPDGTLSINEVSDWIDPLLYAAGTGSDLSQQDVGDMTAWSGVTDERVPLMFLAWSPQPGVVLEIVMADSTRTIEDLIALANQTTAIPLNEWDAIYAE